MEAEQRKVPEIVALVAMGSSRQNYVSQAMKAGGPKGLADETWVINKLGSVYKHDVLFRMDDLRIPRKTNQQVMLDKDRLTLHERQTEWMKTHDKPIITSTAYPEFPTSISYPLEAVINTIGYSYFLTTPAYAAAFACHIGVKYLKVYGCDFVYKENKYISEQGRGNMEFILAICMMKGMKVEIAPTSTLLGKNLDFEEHLYSYENIIEVLPSKKEGQMYEIKVREDLTKKKKDRIATLEKAKLQELLLKYEGDVVKDFIRTRSITGEMIDQYFKEHPEDLNKTPEDFLLEASKGTVQVDPLKGADQCQAPLDTPKELQT